MAANSLPILLTGAASIGFLHTLFGPDHYVPFVAMSKAKNWSFGKTILITVLCGMGHVVSAVLFGVFGLALGVTISKFKNIELIRNNWAIWVFIGFGAGYMLFGLYKLFFKKEDHKHEHGCFCSKIFNKTGSLTPWILFLIFVLGPCEPLVLLMLYPAISGVPLHIFLICFAFVASTLVAMVFAVAFSLYGVNFIKKEFWSKYGTVVAGGIIFVLGICMKIYEL